MRVGRVLLVLVVATGCARWTRQVDDGGAAEVERVAASSERAPRGEVEREEPRSPEGRPPALETTGDADGGPEPNGSVPQEEPVTAAGSEPGDAADPAPWTADAGRTPARPRAEASGAPERPEERSGTPALSQTEVSGAPERPEERSTPGLGHARLLRGEWLLNAAVDDPVGGRRGTVHDVLLDAATGRVLGLLLAFPGDEDAPRLVDYGDLGWPAPDAAFVLSLSTGAGEGLHDGLDPAAVFDGKDTAVVEGEIVQVQSEGPAPSCPAIFKVHDSENLLHRVLVGAAGFVERALPGLKVGEPVKVEGILTRDTKGKLWIASAIVQGEQSLRLRDPRGSLTLVDLTRGLLSVRDLSAVSIRTSDARTLPVDGWVLDREAGCASFVSVGVDGVERAVAWGELERGPGGVWTVGREAADLTRHPVIGIGGPRQ